MKTEYIKLNTCVVGSGAAGFAAAVRLRQAGCRDVAILTENVNSGTSRNTGSDKQTYYKLGMCGDVPDSVAAMARDLFSCGCTDGDSALCEAALSARCFFFLCDLGVPFPCDANGQYAGYKTDHDTAGRASSCGPLTSKKMTECLEQRAAELGIRVFSGRTAVDILKKDGGGEICGLVAVSRDGSGGPDSYTVTVVNCKNIIWATGGPAGIYSDSVYPVSQTGSSGVLLAAGAKAQNLTEWQYGLASVKPRWNVSGSYMQVLPRFISVGDDGSEHEFLTNHYGDISDVSSSVFLKGYEWPFNCGKLGPRGSSLIDLLVYREKNIYGRRVYLDFRNNPGGRDVDFSSLIPEAREYLGRAGICFGRPVDRLRKMNRPAYELYLSKGVDLEKEPLEISLCAQHCNGGIAVDRWWQTGIAGLFVCGEAAGTHGIRRPGGSALNSGQVGALRSATYAAVKRSGEPMDDGDFLKLAMPEVRRHMEFINNAACVPGSVKKIIAERASEMSRIAAAVRNTAELGPFCESARGLLRSLGGLHGEPLGLYRLRDMLITQITVAGAMADYAGYAGCSRGSAVYLDRDGIVPEGFDGSFSYLAPGDSMPDLIQEAEYRDGYGVYEKRPVRPIPDGDLFFENVWNRFMETGGVF